MLGGQAHATLFKGAEDARWILTRPGFTQEVLASSAAVVQDELGIRPSAFRESGVAMLGVKDPTAELSFLVDARDRNLIPHNQCAEVPLSSTC